MLFDVHSHILPAIDDGAADLKESLEILELMKAQGITDVIATPHFYPADDNLEEFLEASQNAFNELTKHSVKRGLPNILLGCELLYFGGISNTDAILKFCLGKSNLLLLELTDNCIDNTLFKDILKIRQTFGVEPIIAHVERYCGAKKYNKFIKFLIANDVPVQINADSVLIPQMSRVIKKLMKAPLFCVMGTDAHSVDMRPPKLAEALDLIAKNYGEDCRQRLLHNAEYLYHEIAGI